MKLPTPTFIFSTLKWATLLGACSVALGAFGAHWLGKYVPLPAVESFQRAVHYQFIHAIALVLVALFAWQFSSYTSAFLIKCATTAFGLGIIFFSGSIYYITWMKAHYGELVSISTVVRLVTPLGGVSFILGWLAFFGAVVRLRIDKIKP